VSMTNNKRRLASGISTVAIVVSMCLATPAHAQTTSTVQGHVEGAAAGSTVTLTDLNTGRSDVTKVDAKGDYIIVGLPPSTYRVQSGGISQTVVVPLGQAVTVDLAAARPTAPSTAEGPAIVVVGARTKDVKTPAVTTNVSRFQIENLPNGDRNFLNFAALAPGVVVAPPTLNGKARQVQAGAVSSDATNTFIDGISIKNLVNHGGTIGQNYSSGNPFPASAVDQFNVETQNFKAEFEQAGSAVISSITKTGGNQFHGEIFGEWQPKAFISRNFDDRSGHHNNPNGTIPKPDFSTKYFGGDIGGPIIKGKLTFFLDFEGTDKTFASSDINVYPNIFSSFSPAAQAFAQGARSKFNGSFPATFKEQLYFGKLTYFATPDDTIHLSAFIRHESNLQINGGTATSDASSRNRNNENRYQAIWNHRGANWLNEFTVARDVAANGSIPNTPGPSSLVTYAAPQPIVGAIPAFCTPFDATNFYCRNTSNPVQIQLGGTNFIQDDHQYQTLIKDTVTLYGGPHTIKFGAKVNFTKLSRQETPGDATFYYDANSFTGLDGAVPYAASINTASSVAVTAKNTEVGLFVQDDWRPDDHWQVSAGLRWDYESNAKNEKFVTPPDVVTALRAYPGWAAAGLDPDDYISTGHNRKPFYGAFQPRLGVSYDVRGDRDLVLFGGAGRYYDRSLFINSALETIKDYFQTVVTLQTCESAPGAPNCIPGPLPTDPDALRALASATSGGEVHLLNNHLRVPYSDELNFGVRKRFGRINTSAAVSYIKSHNIYQMVVGNRNPDGTVITPGDDTVFIYHGDPFSAGVFGPGSAVGNAPLSPTHQALFISNSDGKAKYLALYLQADKPYTEDTGWGFSSTLTLSRTRSNDSRNRGQIGDPFYFDSPYIGDLGWGTPIGAEKWRFVGTGTVRVPIINAKLSTLVTLSSGPKYGGVLCNVPGSAPGGGGCYPNTFGLYWPHGIGYKNVDLNLAKSFKMPWNPDQQVTVYLQALNVFDFVNRNYSEWTGGFEAVGGPGPSHDHDSGSVASQGRNFKAGIRFSF
jgi:outer membrane receptor for ferrienterochelin and colicin